MPALVNTRSSRRAQQALGQLERVWRAAAELEREQRAKYSVKERRRAAEIALRSLTDRERLLDLPGYLFPVARRFSSSIHLWEVCRSAASSYLKKLATSGIFDRAQERRCRIPYGRQFAKCFSQSNGPVNRRDLLMVRYSKSPCYTPRRGSWEGGMKKPSSRNGAISFVLAFWRGGSTCQAVRAFLGVAIRSSSAWRILRCTLRRVRLSPSRPAGSRRGSRWQIAAVTRQR